MHAIKVKKKLVFLIIYKTFFLTSIFFRENAFQDIQDPSGQIINQDFYVNSL